MIDWCGIFKKINDGELEAQNRNLKMDICSLQHELYLLKKIDEEAKSAKLLALDEKIEWAIAHIELGIRNGECCKWAFEYLNFLKNESSRERYVYALPSL